MGARYYAEFRNVAAIPVEDFRGTIELKEPSQDTKDIRRMLAEVFGVEPSAIKVMYWSRLQ